MAVSIAPSVEACNAIVDRINGGTTYALDVNAVYREQLIDPLEDFDDQMRVDVVPESEQQLSETIDNEDQTSHQIRVWIRDKVSTVDDSNIAAMKLIVRQIFQRLNNWDSADRRVRVWECDYGLKERPDKQALRDMGLFVDSIELRVEVEAS